MKKLLLPLFASSLLLFMACRMKGKSSGQMTRFDSCIVLGHKAVDFANEAIRQRDSVVSLLEAWKYAALKCNPKIKVSGNTYPSPSPLPDTTKPQYQKFIRINISIPEYLYINRVKDSIVNSYRQEMGDRTWRMYFELEDYLRARSVSDSVKIGGGK